MASDPLSDPLSSSSSSASPPSTHPSPFATTSLGKRTVSTSSSTSSWARHDLDHDARLFSGGEWAADHVAPASASEHSTAQQPSTAPRDESRKSSLSATAPPWGEPVRRASATISTSTSPSPSLSSPLHSSTRLDPTTAPFVFPSTVSTDSSSSSSQPITIQRSPASSLSRERTTSTAAVYERDPSGTPTLADSYGVSVTPTGLAHGFTSSSHPFQSDSEGPEMSSTPSTTRERRNSAARASGSGPTPVPPAPSGSLNDKDVLQTMVISACTTGDLFRLKTLLSNSDSDEFPSGFALANRPTASGLTPLHLAAGRGHVDLVRWLVRDAGALSELEDSEGETALHKAAFKGHAEVCRFLVSEAGVDVDAQDNDGWTSLHNASSLGWLDIAKLLVDAGAAIDKGSKHGYTALMNAASKGQLPIIHFLLKRGANPLVRNAWNETAYDLAAAVFETRICSVLASYEATRWSELPPPASSDYNALARHSTVAVILEENQRLTKPTLRKISTLGAALTAGPRWSSKALSRNDGRTAFTMPKQPASNVVDLPVFRSEVGLPVIGKETSLVLPASREVKSGGRAGIALSSPSSPGASKKKGPDDTPSSPPSTSSAASTSLSAVLSSTGEPTAPSVHATPTASGEPAWYWLSDWTVDLTDHQSSPLDGWSYASSFRAPAEEWASEPPADLARILEGTSSSWGGQKWVRKRRWVRVMRRRLDLKDWGYADLASEHDGEEDGIELAEDPTSGAPDASGADHQPMTSTSDDYLVRARFLASSQSFPADGNLDAVRLRKAVASLERAADELRAGLRVDEDVNRRNKAEDELEAMLHQLALLRAELPQGEAEEDSDDEFIYDGRDADPDADGRSEFTSYTAAPRPPSLVSRHSTRSISASSTNDYFGVPMSSSQYPDLTPQLSRAPDFRVPTHETPRQNDARPRARKVASSSTSIPTASGGSRIAVWESDDAVNECRRCLKKFSFFLRKHHCRRCGQIFCHACSNHLDELDPSEIVDEPAARFREDDALYPLARRHRTCDACHAAVSLLLPPVSSTSTFFSRPSSALPPSPSTTGGSASASDAGASDVSELADCPVCGLVLASLGDRDEQENHVKNCLESGGGSIVQNGRYLVFKLPPGPLENSECGICYEEFVVGDKLARLNCLCYFHATCIKSWLERGKSCPYHMSREAATS